MNLYEKANISVKSKAGRSTGIEITEGVMQGQTLSPVIFNLFISDLEEYFINKRIRGVSINKSKEILIEACVDDIAILADNIVLMIKIIRILKEYCQEKELKINVNKTKVVIFQKGRKGHKKYL